MKTIIIILLFAIASAQISRTRRAAYMSSGYSRQNMNPNYGDQWNSNLYNPYQRSYYQQQYNPYQNSYNGEGSSYGRSSSYSRPISSYGRPTQFYPPSQSTQNFGQSPPIGFTPSAPLESPVVSINSEPTQNWAHITTTNSNGLFGGVEPGSGTIAPPPTDEEMTQVDPTNQENEAARKARGGTGPPAINVDSIVETGSLPPQASVLDVPMPPSN